MFYKVTATEVLQLLREMVFKEIASVLGSTNEPENSLHSFIIWTLFELSF